MSDTNNFKLVSLCVIHEYLKIKLTTKQNGGKQKEGNHQKSLPSLSFFRPLVW